jgi:hypothetical protein
MDERDDYKLLKARLNLKILDPHGLRVALANTDRSGIGTGTSLGVRPILKPSRRSLVWMLAVVQGDFRALFSRL